MSTAIFSDLHLGLASGRDLLRRPAALEALTAALEGADEVVLLGDVLELRERPVRHVLDVALPVLRQIGGGKRVTIVPGNHDHHLARPITDAGRDLGLENVAGTALPELDEALGGNVRLAYPGVWVRPDVYATHGHYLDVHNTVPSFERLSIGATQRITGAGRVASPADYEAAIGLVNAVTYALAQATRRGPAIGGSGASVRLWQTANGNSSSRLPRLLLTRLAIPGTVALLNRAGLGPLKPDLSAIELREAALRGMHEVVDRLDIGAKHVIFGHTHRSGPHPGDEGWGPLINTGSWIHEPAFLGSQPKKSPYWPGHVVIVPDEGEPELRRTLDELPA